jgi:two-component system, OmpR family, phosphate regulon sensor histidine kinase PhoR
MSIRWSIKILLAFVLVIAVVVIPSTIYLGSRLHLFLMDQKEEELRRELKLAAQMVADHFDTGYQDSAKIQRLAIQVGADLQKRVTIISLDGRILGDSGLDLKAVDKMEDHSHRPEILAAKASGFGQSIRFSTTMQSNALYGAVPFYQKNQPAGYIRLALPLSRIENLVSDLRWNLILAGGLTGLLAILLSFFLTWSINRPLREVTDMVKKMAQGDLKQPFHLLPKTEFSDLTSSLEHMADELVQKMELLDLETSQLTTLLAAMREGVLVTDEKGRAILMNSFLQEILGEKAIWKKRSVQEVFMNSDLQDAVEAVLAGDSFHKLQLSYGRNFQRHFEVHVVALTSAGRPRRVVVLFHDTTELQHLLKVRQDFVANASHELRTPLTSIGGYVETILSLAPNEPPEIRRFLSIIQKNVTRMNLLVSDLLDLAKLDSQETPDLNLKPVKIKNVLQTALQMVSDQAGEKEITFTLDFQDIQDETVANWEKDRIIQALFNIMDNAVKYTMPRGSVRVTAKLVPGSEFAVQSEKDVNSKLTTQDSELPRDFIEISVQDSGIGISREHLSRIFERFYRVDKARSRALGGTGLGLSIVKHIVDAHGGTIQVQSAPGEGSTFTLILPQ